jgi:hypothetical protein
MPRAEYNNPTERIRRLLDEMQELESKYVLARDLLASYAPDHFHKLGAEPTLESYASERTRQQLTYRRTKWTRDAMRNLRTRGGDRSERARQASYEVMEPHADHKIDKLPTWRETSLTPDMMRAIERDVERMKLRAWQPKHCPVGKEGICPMEDPENCICLHPELG